jgi:hypothetical protein
MGLPQNDTLIYVATKNLCGFCTGIDHVHFERTVEVGDFPPVDADIEWRVPPVKRRLNVAMSLCTSL